MTGFSNRQQASGGGQVLNPSATGSSRFHLNAYASHLTGGWIPVYSSSWKRIHTAPAYAMDEIFLWASNPHGSARTLYVGGYFAYYFDLFYQHNQLPAETGMTMIYPGIQQIGVDGDEQYSSIYAVTASSSAFITGYAIRNYRRDASDQRAGWNVPIGET